MEIIRHYTLDGKMELLFKQGEEAIALECTDGYESHYKHDQAICKLRYAQSLMQEALQEMKLHKENPDSQLRMMPAEINSALMEYIKSGSLNSEVLYANAIKTGTTLWSAT
ncbi:hypothetical protein ACW5WN_01230 [Aeromonas lacus]